MTLVSLIFRPPPSHLIRDPIVRIFSYAEQRAISIYFKLFHPADSYVSRRAGSDHWSSFLEYCVTVVFILIRYSVTSDFVDFFSFSVAIERVIKLHFTPKKSNLKHISLWRRERERERRRRGSENLHKIFLPFLAYRPEDSVERTNQIELKERLKKRKTKKF